MPVADEGDVHRLSYAASEKAITTLLLQNPRPPPPPPNNPYIALVRISLFF